MAGSKVGIVGGGISGVACARVLAEAGIDVEIRERAGRVGGRMASPPMGWSPLGERVVDSGASYFTAREDAFRLTVDGWLTRGLAREWTDTFHVLPAADGTAGLGEAKTGPMRYAAPGGLRSLVAELAAGLAARVHSTVERVSLEGGRPALDGEPFDAVVLAMPDPQALRLLDERLEQERAVLEARTWEPVLALLAVFDDRSWPEFDGGFVADDGVLAFVADDGRRRGDDAPVLVAHSTGPWAAQRLEDPQAATEPLAEALDRVLGCGQPAQARVHRWTYARPSAPRTQEFLLSTNRIGFAGDGWGSPKVETAWRSGTSLGRRIAADLGT